MLSDRRKLQVFLHIPLPTEISDDPPVETKVFSKDEKESQVVHK